MTLKKLEEGIYVDDQKAERMKKLDATIFDCDGVLIDVSNSYDLGIKKTVELVTSQFALISPARVTSEMIDGLKRTGGFNDEVDVTYALILAAVSAEQKGRTFPELALEIAKNADITGILSVERYLE